MNESNDHPVLITNRTFDEMEVGEEATLHRVLSKDDILLFAAVSGDVNPAHVDEEFARSGLFQKIIAHGMWGATLISTVLGTVLKIISPQISHKSDVGGVALNLKSAEDCLGAAQAMIARVNSIRPDAAITGFSVQEMVRMPSSHELIVGATRDATFGPVILFGHGGTGVEVINDHAVALPPLTPAIAADMVAQTRVSRLLAGYRDRPKAKMDAIHDVLLKVSSLVLAFPEIEELDINPLLANDERVTAIDARIRLS